MGTYVTKVFPPAKNRFKYHYVAPYHEAFFVAEFKVLVNVL